MCIVTFSHYYAMQGIGGQNESCTVCVFMFVPTSMLIMQSISLKLLGIPLIIHSVNCFDSVSHFYLSHGWLCSVHLPVYDMGDQQQQRHD